MQQHRYTLQKYYGPNSRFTCPECKKANKFTRYIDTDTNQYLADHVGRCERISSCGYHYTPKEFFKTNIKPVKQKLLKNKIMKELSIDFIPPDIIKKTLNGFRKTNLGQYIINTLGEEATHQLDIYNIGRSNRDNGTASIFLQQDIEGRYRTGKIMCYDPVTGKRKREDMYAPKWIHTEMPKPFNYKQCFFGEHFLALYKDKIVAIVESEKTAILASFFMPELIWLATGGVSGVKWRDPDVSKVLEGRTVILFPDFGFYNKPKNVTCFEYWSVCAEYISNQNKCKILVSKVLEDLLDENLRVEGLDIADFLISKNV